KAMQIQPILAALRKHRLATLLIALEVALACAVLCNACSLIANRIAAMQLDSGVDEASLGFIALQGFDSRTATDLNARVVSGLRAIPGIQSGHVINSVPFGPQAGNAGITLDPAGRHFGGVVNFYVGDPGTPEALGLRQIAGHLPDADDYSQVPTDFVPSDAHVLISRSLAEHLWPDQNPLGQEFWVSKFHFRVIGVVSHLSVQQYNEEGLQGAGWTVFVPAQPGGALAGTYLLRADPHDLDRAMAGLMVGVIAALLLVTSLGIVGLASFWVAQRHKQIGIRRALGARRVDILHYFQTENFLIVTFGIVPGIVMALAINLTLMKFYELPRLPLFYLPIGAVVLWALGQLAVLHPALRAAAVPPVVATRTV